MVRKCVIQLKQNCKISLILVKRFKSNKIRHHQSVRMWKFGQYYRSQDRAKQVTRLGDIGHKTDQYKNHILYRLRIGRYLSQDFEDKGHKIRCYRTQHCGYRSHYQVIKFTSSGDVYLGQNWMKKVTRSGGIGHNIGRYRSQDRAIQVTRSGGIGHKIRKYMYM